MDAPVSACGGNAANVAGGVLCQWLLGYKFSIAFGVGYIACFGMAASTGIMMLVYLREAVDNAGGIHRCCSSFAPQIADRSHNYSKFGTDVVE